MLDSRPNAAYTIDFYSALPLNAGAPPFGQGSVWLGSITVQTSPGGDAQFAFALPGFALGEVLLHSTITATATAAQGDTSEFGMNLLAFDRPVAVALIDNPMAAFAVGQPVQFDGSHSFDPDGGTLTYSWDFGDGSPVSAAISPAHAYANAGVYVATLSVSNGDGVESQSISVTVSSTLALSRPTIPEGSSTTLSGSILIPPDPNVLDPTAGVETIRIAWGDGTATTLVEPANTTSFSSSHVYLDNPAGQPAGGSFPITVTASEPVTGTVKGGGPLPVGFVATATASTSVVVNNVAPAMTAANLTLSNANPALGDTVNLGGNFSDPGVLDTHMVTIDWGDGTTPTTITLPARRPDVPGEPRVPGHPPGARQRGQPDHRDGGRQGRRHRDGLRRGDRRREAGDHDGGQRRPDPDQARIRRRRPRPGTPVYLRMDRGWTRTASRRPTPRRRSRFLGSSASTSSA